MDGDKDALKTVARSAFYSGVGSLGVYDYRADAEAILRSRAGQARLVAMDFARRAKNDPTGQWADKFLSDPQNSTLMVFHSDLAQMVKKLKELDEAYGQAKDAREREGIEQDRKALLANAMLLENEFVQHEVKKQVAAAKLRDKPTN